MAQTDAIDAARRTFDAWQAHACKVNAVTRPLIGDELAPPFATLSAALSHAFYPWHHRASPTPNALKRRVNADLVAYVYQDKTSPTKTVDLSAYHLVTRRLLTYCSAHHLVPLAAQTAFYDAAAHITGSIDLVLLDEHSAQLCFVELAVTDSQSNVLKDSPASMQRVMTGLEGGVSETLVHRHLLRLTTMYAVWTSAVPALGSADATQWFVLPIDTLQGVQPRLSLVGPASPKWCRPAAVLSALRARTAKRGDAHIASDIQKHEPRCWSALKTTHEVRLLAVGCLLDEQDEDVFY